MKKICILFLILIAFESMSEDGYRLWLRYERIADKEKRVAYTKIIKGMMVEGTSPTIQIARNELNIGLAGLLGPVKEVNSIKTNGILLVGTTSSTVISHLKLGDQLGSIDQEGFLILSTLISKRKVTVITARNDIGVLYGVFHLLRMMQTGQDISQMNFSTSPRIKLRVLNHWDNLDRTVERGYAGSSLWDWHKLPDYIDPRYYDYARANASIGINGTVLTNVNARSWILTPSFLEKVVVMANVFRPYGIKVYLTARFNAPMELGKLSTADPLNAEVKQWWADKVKEIYSVIPDFGGFVVKANSEGQPGPQNYGRTHADGANMLADALKPYNGIVMWRTFVYDDKEPDDRAKQAYNEFKPLDGKFSDNVLLQVKNGAIDFQPREPFHPLFGAMKNTPLMMEFQLTQEYLGYSTHLVYLASLFKETMDSDTYAHGKGSSVAKVIDGSLDSHSLSGIAGVANIGTDRNWCGHPFAQANWYSFGRLAWDHQLGADQIADEWLRMTFTNDTGFVTPVKEIMNRSREITVSYMTPLGLHHIMGWNHHYGPAPWIKDKHRADWTSVYYHKADTFGIGFNRTPSGSNAVAQYHPEIQNIFSSRENCPENLLLWFHHVGWNEKVRSGRTLWDELCHAYYSGADSVKWMQSVWNSTEGSVDNDRFKQLKSLLTIQGNEAIWWRNACLLYFQTFSGMEIPGKFEAPDRPLDYYMNLEFPFAPGIRPQW